MRVEWTLLSGEDAERLLAMLLCSQMPNATHLRPGQGDGGVDVFDPGPQGLDVERDVYQVKRFTGALTSSHKRQIKRSFARVQATSAVEGRGGSFRRPSLPNAPNAVTCGFSTQPSQLKESNARSESRSTSTCRPETGLACFGADDEVPSVRSTVFWLPRPSRRLRSTARLQSKTTKPAD